MNNDKIHLTAISRVIAKDFQTGENESLIPYSDAINFDELKKYLIEKLSYLLDHKYDKLLSILYKIDVSEEKLAELFSGTNRDSIPGSLAELIIERQLQKVKFRQLYKNGKF